MTTRTYKLRHHQDLSQELDKAIQVAQFAFENRGTEKMVSSADVKHFGLKSAIANQIIRKYARNKKIKGVNPHRVKLTVPNQAIKYDAVNRTIRIVPLSIVLDSSYLPIFEKVNQVELDEEWAYITTSSTAQPTYEPIEFIGIDRNATGHIVVTANLETGRVGKYGKKAPHISKKYKSIRRNLQKHDALKAVKTIKDREARISKDINHKISKHLVLAAKASQAAIVLENLKGVRKGTEKKRGGQKKGKIYNKQTRHTVSSWSFYQLQQFIEYKAKKHGVPILYVDPHYTSVACAKCGSTGQRDGKHFECLACGHVEHADVNAAFNIAFLGKAMFDSMQNEMYGTGATDTPEKGTTSERFVALRTSTALA